MHVPDESVISTLARISDMKEYNGTWIVKQESIPLPEYQFALWAGGGGKTYRKNICDKMISQTWCRLSWKVEKWSLCPQSS